MKSLKPLNIIWYVCSDVIAAIIAWSVFAIVRISLLKEPLNFEELFLKNVAFHATVIIVPLFWIIFYSLTGTYREPLYKKSRLNEFTRTFIAVLIGCLLIFFILILNDHTQHYTYYYSAFFSFIALQFFLTYTGRLFILQKIKSDLISGRLRLPTLIIGNNNAAVKVYKEIEKNFKALGYEMAGYIPTEIHQKNGLSKWLKPLGTLEDLEPVIDDKSIRVVIIALDKKQSSITENLLDRLSEKDVEIKLVPNTLDILAGSVKAGNVLGAMLIEIQTGLMPQWQQNIKRLLDVVFSLVAFVLLTPFLIFIILRTKLSSKGAIIY
ncbi:MAG: hypothetical protein EOP00_35345, partial [Pedobacter sp.]